MFEWRRTGVEGCVVYASLCVNILSLGQLDEEGYNIKLQDGFLFIYD